MTALKLTRDMLAPEQTHYACAWCGALTVEPVLEGIEGDHVCPECADRWYAQAEAEDTREDCCGGSGCRACCGGPRWV